MCQFYARRHNCLICKCLISWWFSHRYFLLDIAGRDGHELRSFLAFGPTRCAKHVDLKNYLAYMTHILSN